MSIKIDNASPESLEGNMIITQLRTPSDDGMTHMVLAHNGAEWLKSAFFGSREAAMTYVAAEYQRVVQARKEMGIA